MSDLSKKGFLEIHKLTVSYKTNEHTKVVLNQFSLQVGEGNFVAIIGPSGCGKSSLLHAIAGFIKSDTGFIQLKQRLVTSANMEIGFVSQGYFLFDWLTVKENIVFGLKSKQISDRIINIIVTNLINETGLTGQENYYPAQLSGGMQQRVALARALALTPTVLLLDEPFSALDRENRKKMHELLLQFWGKIKPTILFVTHDIEEALLLADDIILLNEKGNILDIVSVPIVRPRTPASINTEQFQGLTKHILSHYKDFT